MENSIKIFENPEFGKVRIQMNASNEPMFCLVDVAEALDIKNTGDLKSRLNPRGVVLTDTPTNGGIQQMNFISEGNLYKCIFKSRRPDAEKFQDWVCEEVLPTIRKTGGYITTSTAEPKPKQISLKEQIWWVKEMKKSFNLNDVSMLELFQDIAQQHGGTLPLPKYVNSKGAVLASSGLFKRMGYEKGYKKLAEELNKVLYKEGYLTKIERTKSDGSLKGFWTITEKGLTYGENGINSHNKKETQPEWYVEKFNELLSVVGFNPNDFIKN